MSVIRASHRPIVRQAVRPSRVPLRPAVQGLAIGGAFVLGIVISLSLPGVARAAEPPTAADDLFGAPHAGVLTVAAADGVLINDGGTGLEAELWTDPTAGTDPVVEPTVTLTKKPVSVSATTVKVLRPGTGVVSKTGDKVTVRQVLYLGNEGVKLDSSYGEKQPATFTLSGTDMIPGLISALTGVQKGARILFVIPPAQAFGTSGRTEIGISGTDNLVIVADVIEVTTPKPVLEKAEGTVVVPPAGLPPGSARRRPLRAGPPRRGSPGGAARAAAALIAPA